MNIILIGGANHLICSYSPIYLCNIMLYARHCSRASYSSSHHVQSWSTIWCLHHEHSFVHIFRTAFLLISARNSAPSKSCKIATRDRRSAAQSRGHEVSVSHIRHSPSKPCMKMIDISSCLISARWSCSGLSDCPSSGLDPVICFVCVRIQ